MIGSLRGQINAMTGAALLLDVRGVGYRVIVSPSVLTMLKIGGEAFFYIHDHVREDARDLYGFLSLEDLHLFEQLIGISGVGPKLGLTILSVGSVETVRGAIMSGDLATLTSVPGIGKKTAQKIILELKGQLVDASQESSGDREVVEALQSLGYSSHQAREALKRVSSEIKDVSERVREALRLLSRS
ncbi:MAG: Holliday junction branch migration protein RuvA [Candidatus Uhrbacteria bacterium]|nr:Holliday junction branch migration protein RuvA [Candidatus Uhrbacteria bacterium]